MKEATVHRLAGAPCQPGLGLINQHWLLETSGSRRPCLSGSVARSHYSEQAHTRLTHARRGED